LLYNLGVPGWTSTDLLNALRSTTAFRALVRISQIVSWNVGPNDLFAARSRYKAGTCGGSDNQTCLVSTVRHLERNWDGILKELHQLRDFRRTIVRTMDIYNPYVTEDQQSDTWPNDGGNDFQILKPYLEEVNRYIAASAAAEGIGFASVYAAFNGPDG